MTPNPPDDARWRRIAGVLLEEAERLNDAAARAARLVEAGDVFAQRLGDAATASTHFLAAVRADPRAPQAALSRLARMARETGDVAVTANLVAALSQAGHWPDVVTVLQRRAEGSTDAAERSGLFLEAARIAEARLLDAERARDLLLRAARDAVPATRAEVLARLEAILALQPGDEPVGVAVARLLTEEGRPLPAIDALTRLATRVGDLKHKAALLLDAAILAGDRAGRPVDALINAYEALVLDPDLAPRVHARMDAIQTRWGHVAEVADTLERIWGKLARADKVMEVLEGRLATCGAAERPALLLRMASHAEYGLLDPGRAFDLYRRGLEEGAGDLPAFAAGMRRVGAEGVPGAGRVMFELFGKLGLWRALVDVMEGEAALLADDVERAAVVFQAGEILENRLEDLEGAMRRYLQAFKLCPRDPRYLSAGERLYRRRGDWAMVDRLLGLQVRVAPDRNTRCRLLVEQARVRHRNLDRHVMAYEAVRAALAEGGSDGAMAVLSDLVADDRAFAEIATSLRKSAAEEGAGEASRLLTELAALQLDLRQDTAGGLASLREASELLPGDERLFRRVADLLEGLDDTGRREELAAWLAGAADRPLPRPVQVAALRRAGQLHFTRLGGPARGRDLLRRATQLDPRDPEIQADLLAAARAARDPAGLADVLDAALAGRAGPAPTGADRKRLLRELAGLRLAALNDVEGAIACHRDVLAADPLDEEARESLRALLLERGDLTGLAALLGEVAGAFRAAGDAASWARLTEERARLFEERLGDVRAAAACLAPLAGVPERAAAVRAALHRLYAAAGDRDGELGLLRLELDEAGDDATRLALAERMIARAAEPPQDRGYLLRGLRMLSALRPHDPAPLEALVALLRAADDGAEELAGALERLAAVRPEQPALLRERAELLAGPLARPEAAAAAWEAYLERAPADSEALRALQKAQERRGDFEAVLAVLWRRYEGGETADQRAALAREAAVAAELRLADRARAVSAWQRVLAHRPGDPEALDELMRLHDEADEHAAFVACAEQRLDGLDPPERIELLRRIARLYGAELVDPERAEATWAQVRRVDPLDPEALHALAGFAETRGDDAALAELLGALAQGTRDPGARRKLLERRAAALTATGDTAGAIDAWKAVAALAPRDRAPRVALRELATARQDWWTWAHAAAEELPLVADPAERVALDRQLARVNDEELGDQVGACAAWERVLAAVPGDREALGHLKSLLGELGRTDDMVRVLRTLLDGTKDDAAKADLLQDAARLIEAHRGDLLEAFECWRRAFRVAPDVRPHMLLEMERLAEAAGLWNRYVEELDVARRRAAGLDEEVDVILRQARLAEERLKDPARAFDMAQAAFELRPEDGAALQEMARLAEATGAWDRVGTAYEKLLVAGIDREQRAALLLRTAHLYERRLGDPQRAFEAYAGAARAGADDAGVRAELIRLAEAHGLWDALAAFYGDRWKRQSQTSARIATLHELARVLETRCGDWERAFEQYLLALQLDPQDETTRAEAWRLAEAHDAWGLIARVLELKTRDAEEGWLKIALLHDVAALQEERLGDAAGALETLRQAFAVETWNEKTHREMRRLAERLGAWRELAGFFEEEAGWATEPHARLRLYREAAAMLREHGEDRDAARILRHVLDLDPADADADAALEGMLRDTGDWTALAELLEARARRLGGDDRATVLGDLAAVYRDHLDRPDKAEQVFQRMLALRPADPQAFTALADTLQARGEWERLSQAIDRRLHQLDKDDAEGRRALLRRRAELLKAHLDRPREALRLLARVAAEVPEDLDLLFEISALADLVDSHDELLACAERSAAVADPDRLPEVLTLLGRTARDRFGNRKKARTALTRALDLRGDDVVLAREVAELLDGEHRYGELVALLLRYGPALTTPGRIDSAARAGWAMRLAELQADKLFRVEDATRTIRTALEQTPRHPALLYRLRALTQRAQDAAGLRDAVLSLAALAPDGGVDELASGARDLERLGATEIAVPLWQATLEREPGNAEALAAVARFAEARRDWDLMARQMEARASAAEGAARAAVLCELGELHREQRQDPDAADVAFARAVEADPHCLVALEARVDLARARGDAATREALTDRLIARLERERDEAVAARLAPRAAGLELERARDAQARGDTERALIALRDAHRRAPSRDDVAWALADALYTGGDLVEAAKVYDRVPALPPAPEGASEDEAAAAKATEHLRRARAFRAAGDDERAVRHFEAAALSPATRVDALEALANLQERAGRWEAAVRLRDKLAAAVTDPAQRCAALVAAGLIAETRLQKPARALTFYDRALAEGLADRALLERVLALYREHQRHDAALAVIERLVADEPDANRAAELHCAAGDGHRKRGDLAAARAAFSRALDASPLLLPAARGLLACLDGAPPDEQRAAFRRVWAGCTGTPGPAKIPVLELLGEMLRDRGDVAGALEVYEELNAADPEHLGAQSALAALYGELAQRAVAEPGDADHLDRAIRHRLAFLRARPADPAALRDLIALYRAAGRASWAVTPLRLLALVKQATREEAELARALAGPLDEPGGLVLDATRRTELIADAACRQPTGLLMRALHEWVAPHLDPLFGASREAPGEPASVLHPPLAEAVESLCGVLELTRRKLWLSHTDDRTLSLARLDPPELVAGGGLAHGLAEPERRFLVARALELTRGPAVFAAYLPIDEARALFGAALALALPDEGPELALAAGADVDRVTAWAEFLIDRLDGAQIDALAQLAGPVVASGPRAFDDWAAGVRRTADRVGFILSGDLARAIALLQREDEAVRSLRVGGPEAFRELVERSAAAGDLYRYAFGGAFHELLKAITSR
jgi:hypothetical protein